ncbi:MAG: radical SAM protein [Chloroflexi bacterium]|nr:radical SAM protein [Chloroflexota bacterium]
MATGLLSSARTYFHQAKIHAMERGLSEALGLLTRSSEENYSRIARVFTAFASNETQKKVAEYMETYLAPGQPGAVFLHHLADIHPNFRRKFISRFITSIVFHDNNHSQRLKDGREIPIPAAMVISPTMRCNLRCVGCYAGNYTQRDDLSQEEMEKILGEARELGIRYFIVVGGEPTVYKPLWDMFEKFNDCAFQFYTNGHLLTDDKIARLVELGNAVPALSIEGFKENTDARRGDGAFERILKTMDRLREARVFFAFSATATRFNVDDIVSDEFIDLMVEKGARYGWYFAYCPVGRNPDMNYMPTPEQRNKLRLGINRIRKTKPVLVADFWNDGPLSEGCLASGRRYLHINNKGDVEPCVFVHFAVDNLKKTPLKEALASDFFAAFRGSQPYGKNLLRPCPIIDRPELLRNAVAHYGAYATHEGAEVTITDLAEPLNQYASGLREVYKKVWQEEYGWAGLLYGDTYKLDDAADDGNFAGCPLCR